MLKHVYRGIVLVCIFIAAIFYFSRDMKEVVFETDKTTSMQEATLPTVSARTDETVVNLAHGYKSNLDANVVREDVIPIDNAKTFDLLIKENGNVIKKVKYELREFVDNELLYEDTVSVLEQDGQYKVAKIKFTYDLESEKEYAVKITLITSLGEKIYYYYRVKLYTEAYLKEKIEYVMNFHDTIMTEGKEDEIVRYLESKPSADNSSLSHVNIYSSVDNVCFHGLSPVVISEITPKVKEIYQEMGSFVLSYLAEMTINGNKEFFRVEEYYRIRYTSSRTYLLSYDRTMEALFDPANASISKSQLKLGITSNQTIDYLISADKTKLVFVRNHELWYYDLSENKMTQVFAFSKENSEDVRDSYQQHEIMLLNMDEEQNLNFVVYGYMNRGQYEGKVAIILYHYNVIENRIEEMISVPVDVPYQMLKEQFGNFAYVSESNIFYFYYDNALYAYNMITKLMTVLAKNISPEDMMICPELKYIAWQLKSETEEPDGICVYQLEAGTKEILKAEKDDGIRILSRIDNNLIYGYYHKKDRYETASGEVVYPLYVLQIRNINGDILKTYEKEGYYITDVKVNDNMIELSRITLSEGTVTEAEVDYIMNQVNETTPEIGVIDRITDEALTEWYLTLPTSFTMKKRPNVFESVSTVITEDKTVRIQNDTKKQLYYVYVYDGIYGSYTDVSDAIMYADEMAGVVVDSRHLLIWERGVKLTKQVLADFEKISKDTPFSSSIPSSLWYLLSYQNIHLSSQETSVLAGSLTQMVESLSDYHVVLLEDISFEEACYYISKKRPMVALTSKNEAVVVYGYDATNVYVYSPTKDKFDKLTKKAATELFEAAGNIYVSVAK